MFLKQTGHLWPLTSSFLQFNGKICYFRVPLYKVSAFQGHAAHSKRFFAFSDFFELLWDVIFILIRFLGVTFDCIELFEVISPAFYWFFGCFKLLEERWEPFWVFF